MRTYFVLTLLVCMLTSCTSTATHQLTPTIPVVLTSTPHPDELATNQARWNKANIQDYRFQLMVGCYCPMSAIMPITVEVRNGQVTSMTDVNGMVISPKDPGADFFARYTTITRIYDELTSSRFRDADKITISYDTTYAFPATISVDFIEMAIDDELYLGISGFEVLSK